MFPFLALWALSYLVGAIPFGYLIARWRGVDIFAHGSGNIGATNVGRVLGRRFGILVFLLDFAKGALPVAAALAIKPWASHSAGSWFDRDVFEVGAGLAAFLGHLFPIYLGFRGGKGVATGAGVVAVLCPYPALAGLATWVVVALSFRYVSLASIAAALALCLVQITVVEPPSEDVVLSPRSVFCIATALLIIVRHHANVSRLLKGTENRLKESPLMTYLGKTTHLAALSLWFGTCVFFTFIVALTLFRTFEGVAEQQPRPRWLPLPEEYARVDEHANGPREQGSRLAGIAVGALFPWYFLIQGVCGLVALLPALSWSRTFPERVHSLRCVFLTIGLISVLVGWPVERHVSELRVVRNQAIDAYLVAPDDTTRLEAMGRARSAFGGWHTVSLFLNLGVVIVVTAAMATAARLPQQP